MNSKWDTVEVKEACDLVVDCINNTAPTVERETPYKMIRTSNIENGRLDLSDTKYVTEEVYRKWTRRAEVKPGDVLLTREAPLGEVALVTEDDTVFLGQRIVQFRPNEDVLDSRFLAYAFLSPFVQSQIHKFKGTGSVVDHIRVPDCEEIEIPLPPLEYQYKVSAILGSLDKKFSINKTINRTIEETGRTLFQSWFKNFGPYEDFENTEVGRIPEGWEVGKLGEIMEKVTNGVDPDNLPDSKPYIGLKHMPEECISLEEWGKAGEVSSRKYEFQRGQILFGRLRPYFCKVGIAPTDGISSTDIQIIDSKDDRWTEFLIFQLSDSNFIDYCEKVSTGTQMPRVSWDDMCDYKVPMPPEDAVQKFHNVMKPLSKRIVTQIHESRSVSSLRDVMLPKLISGELEVGERTLEDDPAIGEV